MSKGSSNYESISKYAQRTDVSNKVQQDMGTQKAPNGDLSINDSNAALIIKL